MATAPNSGVAAGKQQPQTTVEPAGGPFIRHSQPGRRSQYVVSGQNFGGTVTQPLVATPGYVRGYRLKWTASGGTGGGAVATADAPFNSAALVTVKDAFGTPIIVAPGYEAFNLIPKYFGCFGRGATRDVTNLQSFQGVNANGNYVFSTQLPFEFAKGYGVISGANASLQPTINVNIAAAGTVYQTAPASTNPTHQLQLDSDFYWLPEGTAVAPPGLGTTCQYVYQQCNPTIASASSVIVQLPRLGGYLTGLVFEMRDANGARIDAWPSRLRILVDGVPLWDTDIQTVFDDMQIVYENTSRPVGVIALSRRTSLSQVDEGLFDTGETYLSTNPGTLIELQGAPWGTIANAPATLSVIAGQVIPSGALIQGLPEL